jgi:hypothetical protein
LGGGQRAPAVRHGSDVIRPDAGLRVVHADGGELVSSASCSRRGAPARNSRKTPASSRAPRVGRRLFEFTSTMALLCQMIVPESPPEA